MKSYLKIIVPIFFAGAIGLFVAYKSGVFDEQPASSESTASPQSTQPEVKKELESGNTVSSKKTEESKPTPETPKIKVRTKEEPVETTQNVNVTPVVMPSSKSTIMINPGVNKKSLFNSYNEETKPPVKKQKGMPDSKSGIMIKP